LSVSGQVFNDPDKYVVIAHNDTVVVAERPTAAMYTNAEEIGSSAVAVDTNEVLNELSKWKIKLDTLPGVGQPVEKDKIYNYNGKPVKCVQAHNRTIYAPEITPALFSFVRVDDGNLNWIENEEIAVGAIRTYLSQKYEALQKHQSVSSWTPVATLGVLWKYYQEQQTDDCEGVKEWTASDHWTTYSIGDRRVDGGALWEVKNVAYTYYQPSGTYGNFGWTKIKYCE
jgi:hypothetical protein